MPTSASLRRCTSASSGVLRVRPGRALVVQGDRADALAAFLAGAMRRLLLIMLAAFALWLVNALLLRAGWLTAGKASGERSPR